MTLEIPDLSTSMRDSLNAYGATVGGARRAHPEFDRALGVPGRAAISREQREAAQNSLLVSGGTRAEGAGVRAIEEEPDAVRTCFERDLDRIRHSHAFRALGGKQQVFLDADGGLRTRLTHSTEVAQIAEGIAQAVGANRELCAAASYGHDCGHTPGGHDGETAFDPFLPGGFDHAKYGADVVLVPLNLTVQTLDAVRQHSHKLAAPATPEAEIVSWADRLAYSVADAQDAIRAGIITPDQLPDIVKERVGTRISRQIGSFIEAIVESTLETGVVSMRLEEAEALDAFRAFMYEFVYLRPAARVQAERTTCLLTQLVEYYIDRPGLLRSIPGTGDGQVHNPGPDVPRSGSAEAAAAAVDHVASLTDRTVLGLGASLLGWEKSALPRGA
jgi:dGTPase